MPKFSTLPMDWKTGKVRFIPPNGPSSEWPPVPQWDFIHWNCFLGQHGWTPPEVEQYFYYDRFTYGFGLRRNESEDFKWFYLPIPRAIDFHAAKTPNILYGGAVGGTKSTTARWDGYRQCWAIPEFTAIIMRRTHQELKRNHMKFVARESRRINDFLDKEIMVWVPTDFELRFKHNDSIILFGHCQNEGDEEKYLSDEYDAFYPDEMATFTRTQILGVSSRLRSVVRDNLRLIPRLGGTSNPGGANTLWLRDFFITRSLTDEDIIDNPRYNPNDWCYIHARLYDNPYLMDPDGTFTTYENRVYARGGARAKQLLNGDWSVLSGQFFEEISDRHFADVYIPPGTKIERWIDWGYSNNGICVWAAILSSGHIHICHEWTFKKTLSSLVAKRIAEETKNLLRRYPGARLGKSVGDPAMWGVEGSTGETYEQTFRRNGVNMIEGDNQRELGWGRFREWLAVALDNIPWLIISPSCKYIRRTIPTLVIDKNNPEDLDSNGEDHAVDAIRYGLMARPSPALVHKSSIVYLPDSVGSMLNELSLPQSGIRMVGQVS